MQVVREELVVELLNRLASSFCSVPSCVNYLVCGCSSVNIPSSHLTPHSFGQFGVIHKLV